MGIPAGPMYPHTRYCSSLKNYFKANVYTIWVREPLGQGSIAVHVILFDVLEADHRESRWVPAFKEP